MRYHTQSGSDLEIQGVVHLAGPQDESQIPEAVRGLFTKLPSVVRVILQFDHGQGGRFEIIEPMKEGE